MKSFALSAITLALTLGGAQLAQAEVITQWSFNSVKPDGATGTGSALPSIGAGSLSLIGGVPSPSFNNLATLPKMVAGGLVGHQERRGWVGRTIGDGGVWAATASRAI